MKVAGPEWVLALGSLGFGDQGVGDVDAEDVGASAGEFPPDASVTASNIQ